MRLAVDTLGQLSAILPTSANEQDRAQVAESPQRNQEVTGNPVEVAFVDQGYSGPKPAAVAERRGIRQEVAQLPTAKRCTVR